ncbi:hypothetical protein Lepil_3446 [Leptonema illini DSM 21528]|uniref:Uncharacterized protein n=1 Tax=Leptonema illini DSM 21528 TaxID=929563 RepID=H2CIT7_9LEPT|nr:hypothetical protein Lepil_3446 [Leptonema illini DSM 21528]
MEWGKAFQHASASLFRIVFAYFALFAVKRIFLPLNTRKSRKKRGESNGTDIENPITSPDFPSGFLRDLSVLCGGLFRFFSQHRSKEV